MAGQIVLWVVLGLLALLLLLLVLPATLYVEYSRGALSVRIRLLFIRLRLLPAKQKKTNPKRERKKERARQKKQAKKAKQEQEEKPKRTVAQTIDLVKRIAKAAGPALKMVLKGLHIRDVALVLPVNAGDPADTALRAGQMQALVGGARAALENLLKIRYKRLIILPDYLDREKELLYFSCKVDASPVIMIAAGLLGLWRFIKPAARPGRRPAAKRGRKPSGGAAAKDKLKPENKAG